MFGKYEKSIPPKLLFVKRSFGGFDKESKRSLKIPACPAGPERKHFGDFSPRGGYTIDRTYY
jgi:hypothetical protein